MSVHLLDTNLLIALAWPQHVHHAQAHDWFAATGRHDWASCPLTQLGFIRISSNPAIIPDAVGPRDALSVLNRIISLPGHHFWPEFSFCSSFVEPLGFYCSAFWPAVATKLGAETSELDGFGARLELLVKPAT